MTPETPDPDVFSSGRIFQRGRAYIIYLPLFFILLFIFLFIFFFLFLFLFLFLGFFGFSKKPFGFFGFFQKAK